MNLTTSTPVEIDTALAAIYADLFTARAASYHAADRLADAEVRAERAAAGRYTSFTYRAEQIEDMRAKAAAATAKVAEITALTVPFAAEFTRRGGWTRAFLVITSGKGHIHRSMTCSTCYATTEFAWLPELSGSDEADIVTAAGADACTVCYPTAPVATAGPRTVFSAAEKRDAGDKAERAAALAEKRAAKAAKAIVDPTTGGDLRIPTWTYRDGKVSHDTIATERTAEIEAVDHAARLLSGYAVNEHTAPALALLIDALAAKRGTDTATQTAIVDAKAAKKAKREYA